MAPGCCRVSWSLAGTSESSSEPIAGVRFYPRFDAVSQPHALPCLLLQPPPSLTQTLLQAGLRRPIPNAVGPLLRGPRLGQPPPLSSAA